MFEFSRPTLKSAQSDQKKATQVGTTSRKNKAAKDKVDTDGQMVSESSAMGGPRMGGLDVNLDASLLLEGMDSELQDQQLFRVYRDMYWHDPVCGSCADTFSVMPFSEFGLGGAPDRYLDDYREAIEILGMRNAMPRISIDHQVTGAFAGSILHNTEKGQVVDMMTHKYENLAVHTMPLYDQDPIIMLKPDEQIQRTLGLNSPRIQQFKDHVGEDFFNRLMQKEAFELDPVGTMYVPRRTFSFGEGVSYFKRVLPIWLIEKNLYRGTLIESGRRQRGILHLMLGEEGWEPTSADFDDITDLFMDADADPIGAVIATRLGISVSELRQGGDFWKVTDIWDQTSAMKMRALGIGEAFLSGDASYATMEGSLTVLVESMRAYRDYMTRETFYHKIFPLVSMLKGYVVRNGKIAKRQGLMEGNSSTVLRRMQDGSKLLIPTVHWAKQLKPEQDQAYIDMLDRLTQAGVPVPLRALAAAGGFNLDDLLLNKEEDLAIQRNLLSYNKSLAELKSKFAPKGGEGGDGMSSFSSSSHSAVLGNRAPKGLLRDYGEQSEVFETTVTGKKKHVIRQSEANRRINDKIIKAIREINQRGGTQLSHNTRTNKQAGNMSATVIKTLGL